MAGASSSLIDVCQERSLDLLRRAITPSGFVASVDFEGYRFVWARDACITVLGACASGQPELLDASRRTLETLAAHQSQLGQIPNAVWPERGYWDWGEAGCTDASCWFVVALERYVRATGDTDTLRKLWPHAREAFGWLRYQDATGFGLVDSPEAGDWIDSTLSRSGKVLHVNVLYAAAARALMAMASQVDERIDVPSDIPSRINTLFWPQQEEDYTALLMGPEHGGRDLASLHHASLSAFREAARPDRGYYLSHVTIGSFADVCDVLGNTLAVLFRIAGEERAGRVLDYLEGAAVTDPYPAKSFPEPITPEHDRWGMLKAEAERHQPERWQATPNRYHNGAVWPFIGGFYVTALQQAGRQAEAARTLERLAEANRLGRDGDWEFREWLAGDTGEPLGAARQVWNAATYVLAWNAVQGRDVVAL